MVRTRSSSSSKTYSLRSASKPPAVVTPPPPRNRRSSAVGVGKSLSPKDARGKAQANSRAVRSNSARFKKVTRRSGRRGRNHPPSSRTPTKSPAQPESLSSCENPEFDDDWGWEEPVDPCADAYRAAEMSFDFMFPGFPGSNWEKYKQEVWDAWAAERVKLPDPNEVADILKSCFLSGPWDCGEEDEESEKSPGSHVDKHGKKQENPRAPKIVSDTFDADFYMRVLQYNPE